MMTYQLNAGLGYWKWLFGRCNANCRRIFGWKQNRVWMCLLIDWTEGGGDVVCSCGVSVFGNNLINSLKAFIWCVCVRVVRFDDLVQWCVYSVITFSIYKMHNKRNTILFKQFFSLALMNLIISMKEKYEYFLSFSRFLFFACGL